MKEKNFKKYPTYYRQRYIVTLLQHAGGSLTKMDFQKLLFLSQQRTGIMYYDFVPYHYGCYSFQAASDLDTLQNIGWLLLKNNDISLLHNLPFEKGLKATEIDKLFLFMRSHQEYRGRHLVRHIYERFPYYAVKSKMAHDVLSTDAFKRVEQARLRLKSRKNVLFTIGYEGISFESYVNLLLKNDIRLLCDVRINPLSRKFGFSKGSLSTLLPKLGIKYQHIPELGIVADSRKHLQTEGDYQRLFAEYQSTLPQKQPHLLEVMDLLETHKRIALTCFEKQPSCCHRHCISDYLKEEKAVRVTHL